MNTNVCILGYGNSGKTTFVDKILGSVKSNIPTTVGVEFSSNTVYYKGKQLRWQIWDCGNYKNYHNFLVPYIIKSHVFLVFLDLSTSIFKQKIEDCINTINEYKENPHIILVCSKADKEQVVSEFDILDLTKKFDIDFIKISCKDDSFHLLCDILNKYFYDNNLTYDNIIKNSLLNDKTKCKKSNNRNFCCIF